MTASTVATIPCKCKGRDSKTCYRCLPVIVKDWWDCVSCRDQNCSVNLQCDLCASWSVEYLSNVSCKQKSSFLDTQDVIITPSPCVAKQSIVLVMSTLLLPNHQKLMPFPPVPQQRCLNGAGNVGGMRSPAQVVSHYALMIDFEQFLKTQSSSLAIFPPSQGSLGCPVQQPPILAVSPEIFACSL